MSIYDEVRARVRMNDAIAFLGLKPTEAKGVQLRFKCPKCANSGNRDLSVNTDKEMFRCFKAGKGGTDATALVAHCKGVSQAEAAKMLAETQPATQAPKDVNFDVEAYAEKLDPTHPALADFGISEDTFRLFKAGYCSSGLLNKHLALPLQDVKGKTIGFFGRSLEGEPHKFPKSASPGAFLFGACHITEPEVRLVRDPLEVLIAYEMGEQAVCFLTDVIEQSQFELLVYVQSQKKCTIYI